MTTDLELPIEHIQAAWHLVQQGSSAPGIDGVTVDLFAGDLPYQLQKLHHQLQQDCYKAQPTKGFYLAKQGKGHRLIGIPTVRDRIVQRLLLQQLYPALEARLSSAAFAYRPGRSIYQAIAQVMERYQHQPAWYEGQAAQIYYQAFAQALDPTFIFEKRTRRPPTDPVNSLLSLGYTLLWENVHAMVEAAGLHTHFGNLHTPRQNHPALVSDLVEEFRACVVDEFVVYLVNKHILKPEDFTPPDDRGGVYLFPDALKKFLKHWEDKLQQTVTHPHTGYKVSYRRCMELQVWEYVSVLTEERLIYRPMRWEK